jgi:hypothetical protein
MAIGTRIAAIGLASLVGSGIAIAQDAAGEPPAIANFTLENGL